MKYLKLGFLKKLLFSYKKKGELNPIIKQDTIQQGNYNGAKVNHF